VRGNWIYRSFCLFIGRNSEFIGRFLKLSVESPHLSVEAHYLSVKMTIKQQGLGHRTVGQVNCPSVPYHIEKENDYVTFIESLKRNNRKAGNIY
jgi:hypothetical protein